MFSRRHAPTEAEVLGLREAALANPCEESLAAFGRAAYLYELSDDAACAKRAGEAAIAQWRASGSVPPVGFVDRLAY